MEQFLQQVGITQKGNMSDDGCYIVDLENEDQWARAESILDRSELLDQDEDSSNITYDGSTIQYDGDDYVVTLVADFESDVYRITCKNRNF